MSKNRQSNAISLFSASVITTISITLVLFILGLALLIGFTTNGFANYLKENLGITIEVDNNLDHASLDQARKNLENNPYVKSVKYISKEDVKKQLIADLGSDPSEILGYDPSHAYFDVYIKNEYVNTESMKLVEKSLKGNNIVKRIDFNQDEISHAIENLSLIGTVLLVLAIVLIIISFILIRSTIQLNIYSKRFLINTMQLVGATNSFIRRPYLITMVVSGIIAAILANAGITAVVFYITHAFPSLIEITGLDKLLIVYILVFVFGILITAIATVGAINRYLRMTTNKLYRS